ncbi:MAG: 2,3-diketo-5-methylthio-phosphopentane phosphatase [Thermoleophilia bacterium]|nr:2,3-diketo-5-methylthio-phosphopentane phosphatase [Thermoleophilia bacterium]
MLIICDFDGTVTARDTNSELARRFAPEATARVAGRLGSRELTLREVMSTEFEAITASLDEVVEAAVQIPLRDGFERFLDAAAADGSTVVLLSSGFRQVIEPMLAHAGLADRVELLANDIELPGGGETGRIRWRDLPTCERCGEPCKRSEVARLRAGAEPGTTVVFVGDGFSDRCGAESADRTFARDNLAEWLDEQGEAYERWDDFDDVARALGLEPAEVSS